MKIILQTFLIAIIIIILGYLLFSSAGRILAPGTQQNVNNKVFFGPNCFYVEIAKTEAERERGLMNRAQLDKDHGMLFIFDKEGVYPFWMKNTLIPLDMIWIDSGNKVVFVADNVQPCKSLICPITDISVRAKYVLEINAGVSKKLGIKIGDTADLEIRN